MADGDPGRYTDDPGNLGEGLHPAKANGRKRRIKRYGGLLSSAAFIAAMQPPDYLVDGLLLRGASYTITGATGAGKTLLALLIAIRVARGEWFAGKQCQKGRVAFFAAENPDNVRWQYFSMCRDLDIDPTSLDIEWHCGPFTLSEYLTTVKAVLAKKDDLAFCIYDSLQAFFEGDDENSNTAMLDLAIAFRDLTAGHPNRPTNLIIAHPVKNASKGNMLPRGGGALLNELDGNLTAISEDSFVELHWQGKWRGVSFDALKFELCLIRPEGLVDARGDQMACTVIRLLGPEREATIRRDKNARTLALLRLIDEKGGRTQDDLAILVGVAQSTISRNLKTMIDDKLIEDQGGFLSLTKAGKARLKNA